MIRFACICGHRIEVDDDLAGTSLQCTACGLLTDVPTPGDLASFTDEGTYRMDGTVGPVAANPARMAELEIIYSKDKQDAEGNEIDLRYVAGGRPVDRGGTGYSAEYDEHDHDDAGEFELKPVAREPEVVQRPKYDPETGELIRPLDVREDPDRVADPASIPVAKTAISYATKETAKPVNPGTIFVQLLMPLNLVVMFFILCVHVFSGVMFVVMASALFFLVPPFIILQSLVLSHYGNVIDHTGRNDHDDLPRPLRDLSWYDDIWSPFVAMFGGLMLSFAIPSLIFASLLRYTPIPTQLSLLLGAAFGTVFGPAILLTTNTSGSTHNLRPDRVMHVIRICGGHYVPLVLLWAVTWPVYLLGWWGFFGAMTASFGHEIVLVWIVNGLTGADVQGIGIFGEWLIVTPALVLGIFLAHYFGWYLGIMYKAHHAVFPWVLQRHVADPNRHRGPRRRPVAGHLVIPPPVPQHPQQPPSQGSSV